MIEIGTDFTRLRASVEATIARTRELHAASIKTQQLLSTIRQELTEVLDQTHATLKAVRQNLSLLRLSSFEQKEPDREPLYAITKAMYISNNHESDIEAVTDELIAAFNAASAVGDDDGRALFADALMQIGRHLAKQVGPQAAGVIMN